MTIRRMPAAVLAALTLATVGAWGLAGPPPALAGACANANATTGEATPVELRKAIVCLVNRERAQRDKRRLESNSKLAEAADRHNRAMVEDNCWKHNCPSEPRLGRRIRNTGYLDGARRWEYAQNFGCAQTPKRMVSRWMNANQPFFRRNILDGEWRDIGADAVEQAVPASNCDSGSPATYTLVFAFRRG